MRRVRPGSISSYSAICITLDVNFEWLRVVASLRENVESENLKKQFGIYIN